MFFNCTFAVESSKLFKMKKIYSIFILLATIAALAALIFFFSKIEHIVTVENYQSNEQIFLSEEDSTLGSLYIDLNVDIPTEYRDYQVLTNIQTQLYKALFGDTYNLVDGDSILKQYTKVLAKEYIDNNVEFAKNISDSSFLVFDNLHQLEGFSLLNDEKIYSYGISRFVDFGGDHPIQTRYFYNFDLKTGDLLTESDLFNEDYQDKLTHLMHSTFIKNINEHNKYAIDSIDISDYNILDIKPNGNFYINDEGICFVFNPYDIAPYYLGETEITLHFEEIKDLMQDKNPISYLYNKKN